MKKINQRGFVLAEALLSAVAYWDNSAHPLSSNKDKNKAFFIFILLIWQHHFFKSKTKYCQTVLYNGYIQSQKHSTFHYL